MRFFVTGFLGLILAAAPVGAQTAPGGRFTVSVSAANVRETPSTTGRVVTTLPRGTVVDVTREEDGWVKIVLLDDRSRILTGYVLGSLGVVERVVPAETRRPDRTEPDTVSAPTEPPTGQTPPTAPAPTSQPSLSTSTGPVSQLPARLDRQPRTRTIGVGGRVGGFTFGVGGSARLWSMGKLGVQMDVSRYSIGTSDSFGGVSVGVNYSVLQFGPSVLYTFQDPDQDEDVWIRPYAGGGLNFYRSTLSTRASGFGETDNTSESASNVGFQLMGGAEAIFKQFPRLGVSGDLGYYSTGTPFAGLQIGGFAYGISLHWYVK